MSVRIPVNLLRLMMLSHPGKSTVGVLCILVSAACYGAMPIFAEFAYKGGADVRAVLLIRFAVAGIVLAILMQATSTPWPRGRDLYFLTVMGAVGYVGQSFAYFSALTMIPAGLASVLYLHLSGTSRDLRGCDCPPLAVGDHRTLDRDRHRGYLPGGRSATRLGRRRHRPRIG